MSSIDRDGVTLSYEEAGSGGPPMLLVHGWGGDARQWSAQFERFSPRRRVVAVDRRGHGRSGGAEGPFDIPSVAEELAWTARELGLRRPVLVVHSMGSLGMEFASRFPDALSALVILDAPALPPPPVRAAFAELLRALEGPGYRDAINAMCDRMVFSPHDDPARRAKLHDGLLATPRPVLEATWRGFLEYDPRPAAARCKVPLLYVNSVMPFDEAAMRELCPHIVVGRAVGAGHFAHLEVPEQVNGMIERFLSNAGLG